MFYIFNEYTVCLFLKYFLWMYNFPPDIFNYDLPSNKTYVIRTYSISITNIDRKTVSIAVAKFKRIMCKIKYQGST